MEPVARTLDAARGTLLGTFVGDALGMPFEGSPPTSIPAGVEMINGRLPAGSYTDDTEMMIALAESLVAHGTVSENHLAASFLARYTPERGYGSGTGQVFDLWRSGVAVADAASQVFGGAGSLGNGAAMRIAPVAVMFAGEDLRRQAELSARVTHRHPVGVDAAVVQASSIAAAIHGHDVLKQALGAARTGEMQRALALVETTLGLELEPEQAAMRIGSSSAAHESVPTAIYSAVVHERLEDALVFAVRCGGDTDTIAAMTGAIVGGRDGASAIPRQWLEQLEGGEHGRAHVETLAATLVSKAPGRRPRTPG